MGKAKYILAFFLFFSAFLFIGESYTFFLENFQDAYTQVGYFLPTGWSEREMNRRIAQQAAAFDTQVFAMEKEDGGAFSRTITLYGNDAVWQRLKQDWNIREGTVHSFFSGETTFLFQPFDRAGEGALQNCWYLDGSPDTLHDMVYPGMTEYSGSIRNQPMRSSSRWVVAGVWLVVTLSVLLLTQYDLAYGQKERTIRLVLGADGRQLRRRKILQDILGFSLAGLSAFLLLLPLTAPAFERGTTLLCFLLMLLLNTALLIFGMRGRASRPLRTQLSDRVLRLSLGFKGLTAVLTILALSVTIGLSVEGIRLYSQKDYYTAEQDWAHVDIDYPYPYEQIQWNEGEYTGIPPLDTVDQVADNFLRYSYQQLDCRLLYHESYEEVAPQYGAHYVLANRQGLEPYRASIPAWDEICSREGNYLLVSDQADAQAVREELLSCSSLLHLTEENLTGVYVYEDGLSIITEGRQDGEFETSYRVSNPVILLDTHDYGQLPTYPVQYAPRERETVDGFLFYNAPYLMQFASVRMEEERIRAFADVCAGEVIRPALMEFSIEGIGDWFQGLWALQNRGLCIAVILTVLLLILEIQITALVLRMTYQTHAKELTVKKVLGYSLAERYRASFLLSGWICGLSLLASLAVYWRWQIGVVRYLAAGSLLVLAIDYVILILLARQSDRREIQKVLKGGI